MGGEGEEAVAAEAIEEPVQVVPLVGQGAVDVLFYNTCRNDIYVCVLCGYDL